MQGDEGKINGSKKSPRCIVEHDQQPQIYNFQDCIERQADYFNAFSKWLLSKSNIKECKLATEMEDKKQGIDLWIITQEGREIPFQVKTDFKAEKTRNICFETVSQAYPPEACKESVIGWGFKLDKVQYITFIIAGEGSIYIFKPPKLFAWVMQNYNCLRGFKARNKTYDTLGVLLPLEEVKEICYYEGTIDDALPL